MSDKSPRVRWVQKTHRYGSPTHTLAHGLIPMGTVSYNGNRSRSDGPENTYVWALCLPGIERRGYAPDLDTAKAAAEEAFTEWCRAAKLTAL